MKLLIHCIHYPVCSGRYAVDAFKRLGHEVYHVGQETGRSIWGMQVPAEYAWSQEAPPDGWQPDLAILMDTAYHWHHDSAPTVVWSVDNHVRDSRQPGIGHYFLAHKSVSVMLWGEYHAADKISWRTGHPVIVDSVIEHNADMTWLPCGYDGHWFTPSPIPWAERVYDVCMIGVMYPKRWELVNAMRAAGLKVLTGTGLVYEAYRDAYQNSRVALVSSFNGDLPIRLFEGAAMGCAVLADDIKDVTALNVPVTAMWFYDSVQDAVESAKDMQETPSYGLGAQAWAAPHSWDARAQVIVEWAEARK